MWQEASKKIWIYSEPEVRLEALITEVAGSKGVVIAHPHPLYGGDMHNNVVEALAGTYFKSGYTVLRFNFRGVGGSTGSFANGIGEAKDLKAAFNYLKDLGKDQLAVAGYSFGAWVIALCLNELDSIDHIVFVSPPVSMLDFSFVKGLNKKMLVITGDFDEIAPKDEIASLISKWSPYAKLRIIKGADHFYWGYTKEIEKVLMEFLKDES